jgi:hemolysin activation/secretion protein
MINFRSKFHRLKPASIPHLVQIINAILLATISSIYIAPSLAQTLPRPDFQRSVPQPNDGTDEPRPLLPLPPELLPNQPASPPTAPGSLVGEITISRFEVLGSTVFTAAELAAITAPATNRPIDFAQLQQVASDITQLYVSKGYVSSGAYIPGNQSFALKNGVVKIQIVEGRVEDIVITGTNRLEPNYVRSRVALGAQQPLKIDRLLEKLQLLQQDPLIASISAELVTGKTTGTSDAQVKITEAPTRRAGVSVINNRTPSVGEVQGQVSLTENNLFGIGDAVSVAYGLTEAGNILDFNYAVPLNPMNGTLRLQYNRSNSRVIEDPFRPLDIQANAQDIALTYRQPIIQTLPQELAVGITLNQRESNIDYLPNASGSRLGFPSPGANNNGQTKVTGLRIFQDYTTRDTKQVLALRSQVSLGLNALGATINPSAPDGQFVSWRGQAQYVRNLAPDQLLVLKLDSQIADRPLVPLEQVSFGGQDSVRGYRQDLLVGDNGLLASAELRFPIFSTPDTSSNRQLLQIVPFLDLGIAWSNDGIATGTPNTIASGGLGLRYQSGNSLLAKLDYGIPLTTFNNNRRTIQEQGLYFSLSYNHAF